MRKLSALLLLVCMVIVPFAAHGSVVDETTPIYTSGDYRYAVNADGAAIFITYDGQMTSVNVPAVIDGYDVVEIGEMAFFNHSSLTSISMPEGLLSIGNGSFDSCTSLTSINLPASLRSIGIAAFSECYSLSAIQVSPDNPVFTAIDGVLVRREDNALIAYPPGKPTTEYSVPPNIQAIAFGAFYSCSSLTSVNLPDNLQFIDDSAFYFCTSLTSISLPASLSSIGDTAFAQCYSLTNILVSPENHAFTDIDGVLIRKDGRELIAYPTGRATKEYSVNPEILSIGDSAFYACPALTSVNIPEGIQSIGADAFFFCEALTSISLPASLQSIGTDAFYGCSSLTLIVPLNSFAHQYAEEVGIPYQVSANTTIP